MSRNSSPQQPIFSLMIGFFTQHDDRTTLYGRRFNLLTSFQRSIQRRSDVVFRLYKLKVLPTRAPAGLSIWKEKPSKK